MFFINLGFLGFNIVWSLFDIALGEDNFTENVYIESHENLTIEKHEEENKDNIFLTLKIFSDKQYDYDQNFYLAKGNVKASINGGILRSDYLSYDKSTGIITSKGNVRFSKAGQYLRGKQFQFNVLKQEGVIKDVYGILDIKNILNDLSINTDVNRIKSQNSHYKQVKNSYNDGVEFAFGNIKLPKNKITRLDKSIGSINNWRFKSELININTNGWEAEKIIFTNDPFDPHQIAFEGIDVIAKEDDNGKLVITTSKTNLLLENRRKIFLGKRMFRGDKEKRKIGFIFDSKDRDGIVLIRKSNTTNINDNLRIDLQPQFLISRAVLGKTYSYDQNKSNRGKDIKITDVFGLNVKLNANYKDWNFDSINQLSTLNNERILNGLRHSSLINKDVKLPILDVSSFNFFTTYRSRAWNGTLGETEIKSAYGGFLEKTHAFEVGQVKNNLNIRFGMGKYEAEKLKNAEFINLWRSSFFAYLDSEYQIWKSNRKKPVRKDKMPLSPVLINPEVVLRSNINTAYFKYEDGGDQGFLQLSFGPEIRLGKLERNFFDYTKLFVLPGVKIKTGNSPFKFDNVVDLKTLNIGFMQQIYGPIIFDISSNLNIDNSSEKYGEYYDTKVGILYNKRAYEFGIYYHPSNDAGGIYFRLNGFKFGNSVKSEF